MKQFAMFAVVAVVVLLARLAVSGSIVEAQTDEDLTVGMSLGTSTVNEDADRTEIRVDLDLSTAQDTDTTISIQHRNGSAGASDYSFTGGSVTIAAGETSGSGAVSITPRNDDIVEGQESFEVVANVGDTEKGASDISIQDDDEATLSISGPSDEVSEGSDAVFTVTLSHDVGANATVAWSAESGSATAGSDFSPTAGTVTFAAGGGAGATQSVSIAVADDNFSEDAENFGVSLGAITGDLKSLVSLESGEASANATIALNDPITINVSGPASLAEGATAIYVISLSPDGVIPPAGTNFVVDYWTEAGTATQLHQKNRNVADYDWKASAHTFNADNPGPFEVSVATFNDHRVEEDETFSFKIGESLFAMGQHHDRLRPRFGTDSVTTTITSDDMVSSDIHLSVDPPTMAEDDEATSFVVTATLDGETLAPTDIPVAISLGGTATAASDYTVKTALSSITIPANSISGSGTLVITPLDDTAVELDEVITLSGSAAGFSIDSADITIIAQRTDTATLAINGPSEAVAEGSDAVFTATLSNLVGGEVTAEWRGQSVASGDNAEMSDYGDRYGEGGYPTGSFTIPANTLAHTFTVPVNDDNLAEPAEVFGIFVGAVSAAGFASDLVSSDTASGGARAFATIAASDPITVSLSGPAAVDEGSETAAYTVSLSGGVPTANLTVNFATADGTAEAGSDYTAKSGTFTFTPDDHADKAFAVQTTADTLEEGDETFTVALSSAAGGGGQAPGLGTSAVTTAIRNVPVPPGRPSSLSAQLDDGRTFVALTWDAPVDGSAPSGYQILRRAPTTEANFVIVADDTGSTNTTYTDTTAAPRTHYVYRVKARNTVGLGQMSQPAEIIFRPEPPGRPSGLSAQLDNDRTVVTLTWDAPADGSAPSGYQILRRAPATEADFVIVADDTGSTNTAYTDITAAPRTKYVYRVKARNAVGLGQMSRPAEIIFRPEPPGRPSGLSAQLDDAGTAIALTWDAPVDGSAPSGYQILRRAPATEADLVIVADDTGSTDTAYTDTTTAPNTRYVYRVTARNAAGLGQISRPAYVTTDDANPDSDQGGANVVTEP